MASVGEEQKLVGSLEDRNYKKWFWVTNEGLDDEWWESLGKKEGSVRHSWAEMAAQGVFVLLEVNWEESED